MTKALKGITIIISVYLVGMVISRLIGGYIPSNVVGMLILFGLLQGGIVKESDIADVCNFMIKNMLLLFIPICVGIIASYHLVIEDWITIVASLMISTVLVMVIVGRLQQYLGKRWQK